MFKTIHALGILALALTGDGDCGNDKPNNGGGSSPNKADEKAGRARRNDSIDKSRDKRGW